MVELNALWRVTQMLVMVRMLIMVCMRVFDLPGGSLSDRIELI